MELRLVRYDTDFLEKSTIWLTEPETKRLTMTPDINEAEQRKWFNTLNERKDYYIRGILADGVPIGAAGIKHIDMGKKAGETWLYIGEKAYRGKGVGTWTILQLLEASKKMGMTSLIAQVATYNAGSLMLHQKCGYERISEKDGKVTMCKLL